MELILLRHAAAPGNLLHQYIGRTDEPLAAEGIRQAQALRGRLPRPDLLFVSPLQRCTQTAALVWPDAEAIVVPALREADFGRFERKTWNELRDDPAYRAWIDGKGDCPGGEPRAAASCRMLEACGNCLRTALESGCRRSAIVAHGGTVMQLLSRRCGGSLYAWQPPLCGGWRVEVGMDGTLRDPVRIEAPV